MELSGHHIFAHPLEIQHPLVASSFTLRENITVIGEPTQHNVRISTKISYIVVYLRHHNYNNNDPLTQLLSYALNTRPLSYAQVRSLICIC